jgi:hypothetical protein
VTFLGNQSNLFAAGVDVASLNPGWIQTGYVNSSGEEVTLIPEECHPYYPSHTYGYNWEVTASHEWSEAVSCIGLGLLGGSGAHRGERKRLRQLQRRRGYSDSRGMSPLLSVSYLRLRGSSFPLNWEVTASHEWSEAVSCIGLGLLGGSGAHRGERPGLWLGPLC